MITGDVAYDGALCAPEPSASPTIAPSTAAVEHREDPPPLYPSAARAKDCPPDSERGGLSFDARQHVVDCRLGNQRHKSLGVACLVSSSIKNARDISLDDQAAHTSDGESDTSGYETDTTFTVDDAVDDDDDDGDEALATFSSSKTIHESVDVVRIAPFPAPPVIEEDEASPVDWAPALPPIERWPADLADLFANNPAGAQTWTEVETAMQRLVLYHAVRDTTHLSLSWHAARDAPAHARDRARAHARRCSPSLLACIASPERMCKSPQLAMGPTRVWPTQSQLGSRQPTLPIQRDQRASANGLN